jgi:DNA-binding LacI/PurR family transcriptional regulator
MHGWVVEGRKERGLLRSSTRRTTQGEGVGETLQTFPKVAIDAFVRQSGRKMSVTVTVRSLARTLGLSRATVSAALRGTGRVAAATAARVRKAAEASGYKHNPLAAALMSELRRSRGSTFHGVIAAIDLHEPDRAVHGPFHLELLRGAEERARTLGFKVEPFIVNYGGLTLRRLDSVLRSRNIHGLLLLPSWKTPDFSGLDWDRYSAAYTDYNLVRPRLHSVCSDHYESMLLTLARLIARGYRRPGLFIERGRNERLHRRHTSACHAFFEEAPAGTVFVPPLITPELSRTAFEAWFSRYQPDVVICHFASVIEWMEACGARVPQTHGFVLLNILHATQPAAGLDLQPHEIGARGIELIVGQLQLNERGLPPAPTRMTILSRWVEGPTVRPLRAASPRKALPA